MRKTISFVLVFFLVFSLVSSLPEPPTAPSMEDSSGSKLDSKTSYRVNETGLSNTDLGYIFSISWAFGVLIFMAVVVFILIKRKYLLRSVSSGGGNGTKK
jgi:beta-lactamase regulating signal transducer with metallopeptidase domain